ncbi:MAG: WS/DGAT/MGAT family O-acyltransferase [Nocardioides sp.]
MSERVGADDMRLLVTESASTPMHNATLDLFTPPPDGFDYDRLVGLIGDRIAFVPRYRQRIRTVPGRLAMPMWVDDDDFDLTYHVRRSALPRPGSMAQLHDLVARIMSRQLDRDRPLWEVYLIEGLAGSGAGTRGSDAGAGTRGSDAGPGGRFAILAKSHQVLVDGVSTIDLGQVILDVDDQARETVHDDWRPHPVPSSAAMVARAVADSVRHPRSAVDTVQANARGVLRSAGSVGVHVLDLAGSWSGRGTTPDSPLNVTLSEQRRFTTVKTDLEDYRNVRGRHGGTVNDVVLATVTGGLRSWLMTRAQSMHGSRSLRVMVPMSVIDSGLEPTSLGSQVAGHLLSLPIGESSPVVRLHQVSYALKAHKETGRAVAANRLAGVAGFAPTTFHALGARVAAADPRRGFNLVVTNVPGPQFPLYAAGALMDESYPVPPLLTDHALAIGVTSYDGGVYFGLTADRDAVPDLDVLAQCLVEALEELLESARESRPRAPRGPQKPTHARSDTS